MNAAQRKILWTLIAAILATLLFPPFVIDISGGSTVGLGYGFLLSWPKAGYSAHGYVHISLLLSEWLAIGFICGVVWILMRDDPNPEVLKLTQRLKDDKEARDAVHTTLLDLEKRRDAVTWR